VTLTWSGSAPSPGFGPVCRKPGAKVIVQRDIDASFSKACSLPTTASESAPRNPEGAQPLMEARSPLARRAPPQRLNAAAVLPGSGGGESSGHLRAVGAPGFSGSHDAHDRPWVARGRPYQGRRWWNEEVWQEQPQVPAGPTRRKGSRDLAHPWLPQLPLGFAQPNLASALARGLTPGSSRHFMNLNARTPGRPQILRPHSVPNASSQQNRRTQYDPIEKGGSRDPADPLRRWPPPKALSNAGAGVASRCRAAGPTA